VIAFALEDDAVVLRADPRDADLFRHLSRELQRLLESRTQEPGARRATPRDPALARLLPDPVHGDVEASMELREMTERALISKKVANARLVEQAVAMPGPLDEDARRAWLQHLTDLRLVLAARIGIERDGDTGRGDTEDERWLRSAYHWLGALQEDLLQTIERLEERTAESAHESGDA